MDFVWAETKIFQEDMLQQYVAMVYHALMIFGLNEVAPVSQDEVLCVVIMMVLSAIANAYIFGEMSNLVAQLNEKQQRLQDSLDDINTIMDDLQIPDDIRDKARKFVKSNHVGSIQHEEFKQFRELCPKSKWEKIEEFVLFQTLLHNNFINKMCEQEQVNDEIKEIIGSD